MVPNDFVNRLGLGEHRCTRELLCSKLSADNRIVVTEHKDV